LSERRLLAEGHDQSREQNNGGEASEWRETKAIGHHYSSGLHGTDSLELLENLVLVDLPTTHSVDLSSYLRLRTPVPIVAGDEHFRAILRASFLNDW
jgi:hypothetical protein